MRPLLTTLLAFSLASSLSAQQDLDALTLGEHRFERRILGNGLRAMAVRDEGEDVTVFLAVAAGNRQESAETTGLAHLTEHALFTGTPTTGTDEHEHTLVAWGAESNAFTRDDYTMYYDHGFPAEKLEDVLRMEADRMSNLHFPEKAVLHERHRLEVEEKHSYRRAEGRAEELEHAFFTTHPYRHGLRTEAGHTKGPELSIEQIQAFYGEHYRPERLAVVVVGPIEPKQALDAIEAAFGKLENPKPAGVDGSGGTSSGAAQEASARLPQVAAEPATQEPQRKEIPSQLPRDRFVGCWLTPAMGHADRAPLVVLAALLGREQLPSGEPLTVSMGERLDADIFQVGWSGEEGVAKEVAELLASYRDGSRLSQESMTEVLAEVKTLLVEGHETLPLRARPYFSLAGVLAWHEVFGHGETFAAWGSALAAVEAEDVARVATTWLAPQSRTLVVFLGTGEPEKPLPEDEAGLHEAAAQAAETGDFERAIQASTKLLALGLGRVDTVIQYASRGQYHMELNDFDSAIADFEAALDVVDYPAVRDLLEEALARKARAMRGDFE